MLVAHTLGAALLLVCVVKSVIFVKNFLDTIELFVSVLLDDSFYQVVNDLSSTAYAPLSFSYQIRYIKASRT